MKKIWIKRAKCITFIYVRKQYGRCTWEKKESMVDIAADFDYQWEIYNSEFNWPLIFGCFNNIGCMYVAFLTWIPNQEK